MFWLKKEKNIKEIFTIFLILEWFFAFLQLIGGVLLLVIEPSVITKGISFLIRKELIEDQNDYIANYLLYIGSHFSLSVKTIVVIYLLFHGAIKLYLIYGVWKNKINAYIFTIIFFSLFLVYEIYKYYLTNYLWILALIIIDIIYIYLLFHEYKILKNKLNKN